MEEMQLPHRLTLLERKALTVTGVTEVIHFDESTIALHTELGTLELQGEQLQLKALTGSGGQLAVEGHICALRYEEPRSPGFWRRLIKW